MSANYDAIPETQKQAYLANAEAAFTEAAHPVWETLGQITIGHAEDIIVGCANASRPC